MNPTTVLAEFKDYPTFTDRYNLIPTMYKKWKCSCLPSLTDINLIWMIFPDSLRALLEQYEERLLLSVASCLHSTAGQCCHLCCRHSTNPTGLGFLLCANRETSSSSASSDQSPGNTHVLLLSYKLCLSYRPGNSCRKAKSFTGGQEKIIRY